MFQLHVFCVCGQCIFKTSKHNKSTLEQESWSVNTWGSFYEGQRPLITTVERSALSRGRVLGRKTNVTGFIVIWYRWSFFDFAMTYEHWRLRAHWKNVIISMPAAWHFDKFTPLRKWLWSPRFATAGKLLNKSLRYLIPVSACRDSSNSNWLIKSICLYCITCLLFSYSPIHVRQCLRYMSKGDKALKVSLINMPHMQMHDEVNLWWQNVAISPMLNIFIMCDTVAHVCEL